MWRSVSKFAMRPPLEERKWREICCFSSAWVTSFIKNRTNSAPEKNSELPSHAPSLGILPFFLQMSRPLLWTPKKRSAHLQEEWEDSQRGRVRWQLAVFLRG